MVSSVKKGEKVNLIVRKNGILLKTVGTAVESGIRGEWIRVMLKKSRKKIMGRVAKSGVIEVNL